MQIPEMGSEHLLGAMVTSKIGRIEIQIDQDVIASALEFNHPLDHERNYPRPKFATADEINQALYINLADARDPHMPGKFKEEYKLINQLVHFSLNPQGAENKPSLKDGKLLMRSCDWAR